MKTAGVVVTYNRKEELVKNIRAILSQSYVVDRYYIIDNHSSDNTCLLYTSPENLLDFVQILSEELVRAKVLPEDYDFEAHKELVPMQPGDVPVTYADTSALERDFGYKPSTDLRTGLRKFAEWYAEFYK